MKNTFTKIGSYAVVATLLLSVVASVGATGQSSARSMAMSGAYIGLAAGVDAARYNPANLGLDSYRSRGIELLGLGVNMNNNALSLSDYNRYTGAVLQQSDKDDILGNIPSDGLRVVADVEASALSLSLGSYVISVSGVGVADVNLSKDILDLVLNGNHLGQTVSLDGSYSDAVAYIETSVTYGRKIYQSGTRQASVGLKLKYLRGMAFERITDLEGGIQTLSTGFTGSGRMVAQTATGGSGFAADLGAALQLNDDYTVGLNFKNILSSISWSSGTEEHGYLFDFDSSASDIMQDDYIVSEDYSHEIGSFSSNPPSTVTLGIANTSGQLLWAVDWQQGFRKAAGASSKPRLAAGLEWRRVKFLPLRAGFGTGGSRGTNFSAGMGLHLGGFRLDCAFQSGGSLSPSSSRGLNFAMTTGFDF